ncbi:aminotransferase class I/II-fold pyridoxal phosphate-dependent enzyme [Chryseobacterium indologenes]|uniref:aminotransferase class I/II-fold pyridoxal phosphate-dependent enzyme n=1 Tax=Chryseobacterium indologenes TaxID=253 RepID=UPI0003E083CD|nr:aminotransferase class I/II-fold pyridoxal phosphate-dependent enzyme [Chryseobacterium indologenes]QPQ51073.1 aminotransferase class I/II-fold pyridoxal phosphate-dependent enzyme [Chryseobacterium indologenes]GAE65766.1 putative acyltransferase [Chryseobacterium indologenes NBRC 14944]SFK05034.1 glycine C-acetyltransferase [Chryseobacterium indologenes]SUX49430.1 8-amino-7-oxononanoate synthase/2-amino-3-ketobutyrate coenzyme A ligase [Chryseobacterium indologenes]
MSINFATATFRDFENIPDYNMTQRAELFHEFLEYLKSNGHVNYRLKNNSSCNSVMNVNIDNTSKDYISFVSNDYLGFTQHPKVKQAAIDGIMKYGTGAGASPLIGGHFSYHDDLEKKIATFFGRKDGEAVIFTTGYTANSATLQILLQKEDIAIIDMAVHTSVKEGCVFTNSKTFPHNNLEALEQILIRSQDKFRTKLVIIDGVYSQDGDISPLKEIYELVKKYDAYLMVDDAHGVGILGETGRGALEEAGLMDKVDFITGTFSKTFGSVGGYVICNEKIATFIKFQSRQQIFSATAPPSIMGITKAIELIDEEPMWRMKLWENINYFKKGLNDIGLDTGTTSSAIVPVKIGNQSLTGNIGKLLLEKGIYANAIMYPAVSRKDSRIRMAVMATHERKHLDKTLNAFEDINNKLHIAKKFNNNHA